MQLLFPSLSVGFVTETSSSDFNIDGLVLSCCILPRQMPQIVHKDDNSHGSLWLIFVTSIKFTFRAKEDGCIVFIGRHTGCQSGTALLEFVSSSKALARLVLCAVFLVSTHYNSSSVFAVQFFYNMVGCHVSSTLEVVVFQQWRDLVN